MHRELGGVVYMHRVFFPLTNVHRVSIDTGLINYANLRAPASVGLSGSARIGVRHMVTLT